MSELIDALLGTASSPGMSPYPYGAKYMDNIVDKMVSEYPNLKKYNIGFVDSMGKSTDYNGYDVSGRKLEFYPPTESENPILGKPTIEQFSPDMTHKDALGEIFSHYLPSVDPVFKDARSKFVSSITSDQKENMLRPDYDNEIKSGVYGNKAPSFSQWINAQGGDAYFRGYIADQYPKESYTSKQKEILSGLEKYLGKK